MSIRVATSKDLTAVRAIDEALGQRPATLEAVTRALSDKRLLVAERDGEIVGYLWWSWFWDKVPMSTLVRVRPEAQRTGVGAALYAAAEERLREMGCSFWMSSTEEDNERSLLFHKALGFREIGALSDLDQPVREVFMRKDLG